MQLGRVGSHVSPRPCVATGLCFWYTSTRELMWVRAPCSRHEDLPVARASPLGWLVLSCVVWGEDSWEKPSHLETFLLTEILEMVKFLQSQVFQILY